MSTGQISSQALQVVQAQSSSGVMRSNTESAPIVMSRSTPTGGATTGSPVAAITSPTFRTISRGSSGFPVACAGHTDVHRPQIVQASVSNSCFHVKSSTVEAPNVSSSVSIRFGIGRIAPFGRSRSRRYMFIGDVNMWRSFVAGRITRKATNAAACTIHIVRCRSDRVLCDQCAHRAESPQPTKDHSSKWGRPSSAIRNPSMRNPVTPIRRSVPRITASSGLVLIRIR